MRVAHLVIVALLIIVFSACTKNSVSNIPFITFTSFGAKDGSLVGKANKDAMFLTFSLTDGDGDLGRSDQNDVYVEDSRFPGIYKPYAFPRLDALAQDPKKGVEGSCRFIFTPDLITPRPDSVHTKLGDTMSFRVYIVDQAGHQSDTIQTPAVVIVP